MIIMISDSESEISPVVGIIISTFTDAGPQVIYNSAEVSEDTALSLSARYDWMLNNVGVGSRFR